MGATLVVLVVCCLLLLSARATVEATTVDCHTADECLVALRGHLIALQDIEDALSSPTANSLSLLQLQVPLNRFTQLADRMVAIADYLAHSTPHVPPNLPVAIDANAAVEGKAAKGAHDDSTAAAFDDGDEEDEGEEDDEAAEELRQQQLVEHTEDRELYVDKLETLHRIVRKVQAIKATGSTQDRDPSHEIAHLEELYRTEAKRMGDEWADTPLADQDYDEFADEAPEQYAHYNPDLAASTDDPGLREIRAIQKQITAAYALPGSEREQRLAELSEQLLKLWESGKYADYIKVISLSSDEERTHNVTWSMSPDGILRVDSVHDEHDDYDEDYDDDGQVDDDEDDETTWI